MSRHYVRICFLLSLYLCMASNTFAFEPGDDGETVWNGYHETCNGGFSSAGAAVACTCSAVLAANWWQKCSMDKITTNGGVMNAIIRVSRTDSNGIVRETTAGGAYGGAIPTAKPPEPSCSGETPNPVKIARGEKYYDFTDINSGGAFPLSFGRTYRSRVAGKIGGNELKPVGKWHWPQLSKRLYGTNTTAYIVRGANSGGLNFSKSGGIWIQSTSDVGVVKSTLTGDSTSGWTLTLPHGAVEQYNSDGYLTLEKTPHGLSRSITYIDAVAPSTTQTMIIHDDQTDQELVVTLDGRGDPLSASMDGLTVEYIWDANARLHAVVYPDADTDPVNNPAQVFEYNAAADASASVTWDSVSQTQQLVSWKVTGIFEVSRAEFDASIAATPTPLPESKRYSKVTYDTLGRVSSSALWTGTQKTEELTFEYTLPGSSTEWNWSSSTTTPATRVTNSSGLTTTYTYSTAAALNNNNTLNDWRLMSVDGAAHSGSGCAAVSASTGYSTVSDIGGAGFVKTTTDNTGDVVTKRDRDSRGRITTLQTALNSSLNPTVDSKKIITIYANSATTLPASKTYYGYPSGSWEDYKKTEFTYYSGNNRIATRTEKDLTTAGYPDRTWTYHYAPTDNSINITQMTVTDPKSHTTTYNFNAQGQIASRVNALGHPTAYADYNAFGLPKTITDPNGVVTALTYDTAGRLASSSTAGLTTTYDYYPNGLLQLVTRADGSSLEYFWNSAHQLTKIEHHHGTETDTLELTPSILNGKWTSMITKNDADEVVMEQHRLFDALGRLWKQLDADENTKTVYGYDENDNLKNIIALGDIYNTPDYDDNSRVVYRAYDGQNRVTSETRCNETGAPTPPLNCSGSTLVTTYGYDEQGNINSVTDANSQTTSYVYNGFGELIEEVSPDRGTTLYTYDAAGNLATKTKAATDTDTDGAGPDEDDTQVIIYTWDALNRLTAINYPGTTEDVAYSYDTAASEEEEEEEDCNESSLSTSSYGRLCRVTKGSATVDYTYNALGRITKEKVRPLGSSGIALATEYAYNTAGELTGVTYPGGRTTTVTRSNGHISNLASNLGSTNLTLANNLAYQPFGGISGYDLPVDEGDAPRYEKAFNTNGQLSQWQVIVPGGDDHVRTYYYDAYGNIELIGLPNYLFVAQYTYDALNRLETATGSYGQFEYDYDSVGNRTQLTKRKWAGSGNSLEAQWVETYQYATGSNRLESTERFAGSSATGTPYRTRTFTHDGRGNIKQDVRAKTGQTTYTLDLEYGDGDRLNSVDVQ